MINFHTYIQNKKFGNYYLPSRFQYVIFRDYFKKINQIFSLPQGEPVFSKTSIRLRTILSNLKKNDHLVLISIYVLPEDIILNKEIIETLIKKKITTHFIFENVISKTTKEYHEVLNILEINKHIFNK
tara:strand:- start:7009 stop:7392 length:384 start_codon:yes stop_codon:yes gene_type:complete